MLVPRKHADAPPPPAGDAARDRIDEAVLPQPELARAGCCGSRSRRSAAGKRTVIDARRPRRRALSSVTVSNSQGCSRCALRSARRALAARPRPMQLVAVNASRRRGVIGVADAASVVAPWRHRLSLEGRAQGDRLQARLADRIEQARQHLQNHGPAVAARAPRGRHAGAGCRRARERGGQAPRTAFGVGVDGIEAPPRPAREAQLQASQAPGRERGCAVPRARENSGAACR